MKERYENLLRNENFINASETATADDENVRRRMQLAADIFKDIK
ncbi:MAG: hypothetical protein ACE5KK_01370 [Candidatus Brocadiales bacterium]